MGKILIIDPAESFVNNIEPVITKLGFGCLATRNAKEALEKLRTHLPILIITSSQLPNMDAGHLCRRIKSIPNYSDIPMILIKQADEDPTCEHLEEGLFTDCLTKPLTSRLLFNTLERNIPNRNKRSFIRAPIETQIVSKYGNDYQTHMSISFGEGGTLIQAITPRKVGSFLELSIKLPGMEQLLKIKGQVVYAFNYKDSIQLPCMGIKFIEMDEQMESFLTWYMESHLTGSLPEKISMNVGE